MFKFMFNFVYAKFLGAVVTSENGGDKARHMASWIREYDNLGLANQNSWKLVVSGRNGGKPLPGLLLF